QPTRPPNHRPDRGTGDGPKDNSTNPAGGPQPAAGRPVRRKPATPPRGGPVHRPAVPGGRGGIVRRGGTHLRPGAQGVAAGSGVVPHPLDVEVAAAGGGGEAGREAGEAGGGGGGPAGPDRRPGRAGPYG